MPQLETITGEVLESRVLGTDFFGIAKIRQPKAGPVEVVGKLLGVQVGDTVDVHGAWTTHPRYGRRFQIQSVVTRTPKDSSGVVAWLSSRLPQLGATRAAALVQELGAEGVWNVIENDPDRLLTVKGITPERRDAIVAAYQKHRGERDRIVLFKSWGLTDGQIARVLAQWGARAEERIRADPFDLVECVYGFGFSRADSVARRMGLEPDAPARIRAGLLHVMKESEEAGHCYLVAGRCVGIAAKLLELDAKSVAGELRKLVQTGRLARVGESERIALPDLAKAETEIARRVRAMSGPTFNKERAA